ncbi:hypothetical protein [Pseudomonas sp. Larv2_ips]|uniref:hypothetical protein n=1 Tax=Pseudomonas sp. Larv2_ips TaxID=1896942 RepID=UPI0015AB51D2|nr:hypothetical protein [Pseudomonas sp. Larv2_ips]
MSTARSGYAQPTVMPSAMAIKIDRLVLLAYRIDISALACFYLLLLSLTAAFGILTAWPLLAADNKVLSRDTPPWNFVICAISSWWPKSDISPVPPRA